MKNLVIILTSSLLLFSCIKNKTTTIEGILMTSCDTPAANTSGVIKTEDAMVSDGVSLPFATDENGYFKVSYTGRDNLDKFRVIAGGSEVLSVWMLPGREKDLGKVHIYPFPTNFIIKLDVKNTYTANDTLVLRDYTSSNPFAAQLISGPFTSGFLDSVVNFSYFNMPLRYSDIISFGGPQSGVSFRIRSIPTYVGDNKNVKFYLAPICSGEFAEVTLVIE